MSTFTAPEGVEVRGEAVPAAVEILTPEALEFVATLHRAYDARRRELLQRRVERGAALAAGQKPDFLPETAEIREGDWRVAPVPADLQDRRVEITGPVDRKMIINALNSGAKVFMADFEDSNTPTWENTMSGQVNLRDAVARTIEFHQADGKQYRLKDTIATLIVRPRGWHMTEKHLLIDGQPASASIVDFGLYFFHNHAELKRQGTGPYFYLPKMESHLEARLWNDIFVQAQDMLGVPQGTIKGTVLIETILAAFEMDEILYELREHSAGLNCGRWDYIFSCIKKFGNDPEFVLADRGLVTMTTHFMRSYSLLAIKTCHRREIHAMGGMAAQIPIKGDPEANEQALAKVRADKEREATDGHDGTWVAHPGLVPIAMEAFDAVLGDKPNQIDRKRDDVTITGADLLEFGPIGPITEAGLRQNVNVGIQYLGAWLGGTGCVPLFNLMEDAATAEISRSQVWQWVHSPKGVLDDGRTIDMDLVRRIIAEEMEKIRAERNGDPTGEYGRAAQLFEQLVEPEQFEDFLTLPAYQLID
ncbi:MAG TPA: malate synthase A [Miltoncostaeaceae bacterium]|jgi:malate synthase|nr:malate synthase A [Miltoncostaeaceae bacterium]